MGIGTMKRAMKQAMKQASVLGLMLSALALGGCAGASDAPPSLISETGSVAPPGSAALSPQVAPNQAGAVPAAGAAPQTIAQNSAPGWAATPSGPAAEPAPQMPAPIAPGSSYQLSEQELKYDCKKLTGTMQIRILQIRDYETSKKTSTLARTAQAVATPIWGGTTVGIDPDGQYRKDLAMLDAYNQRLATKRCKTFNLAAELQKRDPQDMPTPQRAGQPH